MTRVLVIGGTRSGKTAVAEQLAAAASRPALVVATGEATDAEIADRIRRHRARRLPAWRTVETDDLAAGLAAAGPETPVVVDALDSWLARRMGGAGLWTDAAVAPLGPEDLDAAEAILDDLAAFWSAAATRPADTIVVAGQPGWAPTPSGASTRRYLDLHGDALQFLSAEADRVLLVVAGRAVEMPPAAHGGDPPPAPTGGGVAASDHGDVRWAALRDHGDTQAPAGNLDLAVNVVPGPPPWLRERLAVALDRLDAYPATAAARTAAAARHGRPPGECLLLDGAAEAFWLLASALRPRLAACVHPSFTEAEAALRAHGHRVVRVVRDPQEGWVLHPAAVPDAADLVVLGRPDNPTGALDPADVVAALARPGRVVVVDEAFAEFLDDPAGLAARRDLPGLVAVRSLTKIWGLAGLRVGYLLADASLVDRLDAHRQPWAVNSLAAEAVIACAGAEAERRATARQVADHRAALVADLADLPDVEVWAGPANFVLLRAAGVTDLRSRLLARGVAVRRGETFPGLGPDTVRVAVRDRQTSRRFVSALADALAEERSRGTPGMPAAVEG